jgi:glycosyltransferase involved in cell wall biosynthesis
VWVGAFKAGKALPLGLRALRAASDHVNAELHILGGGPCETAWKKLASRLGIAAMCAWYGRLDHDRALAEMRSCDAMLVCSLMEGTSNALMEALSLGVPVICHDAHGSAAAVDESCGIKVPLRSPSVSVAGFADAVIRMGRDPALVQALSQGALARAQALSWDRKAEEMVRLYREALSVKGSRDVI